MGKLDQYGDAVRGVIRAFHGSPYDFDRFDASKIGSGEGAQAYGHGLYFAGNEDVAEFYRRAVSATKRTPQQDAEEFIRRAYQKRGNLTGAVLDVMDQADASLAEATATGMDEAAERWSQIRDAAGAFNIHKGVPERIGRTYEVEIQYPEGAMLNYDKPFSEESGAVAAAVLRDYNPAAISPKTLREIETGEWRLIMPPGYGNPYERVARELHSMARTKAGAQAMKSAGIPGVKYLDDGSRYGDGPVTRNYVMFPGTEDSIRILRKYGIMAPMAAGAAAGDE